MAVQDLHTTTAQHCPDCNYKPCACSDASVTPFGTPRISPAQLPPSPCGPSSPRNRLSTRLDTKVSNTKPSVPTPENLLPANPPILTNLEKLDYTSRYACRRPSPLVCPNQALVRELDIIRQSRMLECEERSALSYQRALSVIKGAFTCGALGKGTGIQSFGLAAYPHEIRSLKQVAKLPYIGVKITGLVRGTLGHMTIVREEFVARRSKNSSTPAKSQKPVSTACT